MIHVPCFGVTSQELDRVAYWELAYWAWDYGVWSIVMIEDMVNCE